MATDNTNDAIWSVQPRIGAAFAGAITKVGELRTVTTKSGNTSVVDVMTISKQNFKVGDTYKDIVSSVKITFWGNLAKNLVEKKVLDDQAKGKIIVVLDPSVQYNEWEKDGEKRISSTISVSSPSQVVLDGKYGYAYYGDGSNKTSPEKDITGATDDESPFDF